MIECPCVTHAKTCVTLAVRLRSARHSHPWALATRSNRNERTGDGNDEGGGFMVGQQIWEN